MLLADDYSSNTLIEMDSNKTTKGKIYQPLKPVICRFFKPKIKDKTGNEYDGNIQTTNVINLSPQSIKLESLTCELEPPVVSISRSLSSIESSSLSNFPQFSGPYSKSTQSLSDTEMLDQSRATPTPPPAPIVSGVYSLNKSYQSPPDQPIKWRSKPDENGPSSVHRFMIDLTDDEEFRPIKNIFQLVKQAVPCQPGQITDQCDRQSIDSDNETEPMLDDRDYLDECNSVFQPLLQPSVVLEPITLDCINQKVSHSEQELDKLITAVVEEAQQSKTIKASETVYDFDEALNQQNDHQSDCVILREEKMSPGAIRKHSRRSLRPKRTEKTKRSHSKMISSSNDKKFIYCFQCRKNHLTLCENHPVTWILNDDIDCPYTEYVTDGSYDKFYRDRRLPGEDKRRCRCQKNELEHIQQHMPREFSLRESKDSEIGVWTTTALNLGTIIGPYLGEVAENWSRHNRSRSRRSPNKARQKSELVCLQSAFKSNWLRNINFTSDPQKANLKITSYDDKIFYQAIKVIYPGTELFVCKKLEFGESNHQNLSNIETPATVTAPNSVSDTNSVAIVPSAPDNGCQSSAAIDPSNGSSPIELAMPAKSPVREPVTSSITIFDPDQLQYLSHLLATTPSLGCPALNSLMRARFPDKPAVTDAHIERVIRLDRLRPLCGLDSGLADHSQIQTIVELYRERPRLTLVECLKILTRRFPRRPPLDLRSIDRIVELNRCRKEGPESGPDFRIDKEVVSEIKTLLGARPGLHSSQLVTALVAMFPDKRHMLTKPYVKFMINKFHLRRNCSISVSKTTPITVSKATPISVSKTGSVSVSNVKPMSVNKIGSAVSKSKINTVAMAPRASSTTVRSPKSPVTVSKAHLLSPVRTGSVVIAKPGSASKLRSCGLDEQMHAAVRSIHLENPELSAARINAQLRAIMPAKPEVSNRVVINALRKIRQAGKK